MKINRIKLNKIITVVCAALVAFTTIIYTAIPASAESWTDWASASEAAQQLAQAYYEVWQTNDDKSVADYFSDWADIPISWLKASTAVSSGYILSPADDIIYYLDENGLLYKDVTRAGGGGRSRVGSSSDIVLDGETFADICERLKDQYAPSVNGDYFRISRSTDKRWSSSESAMISFYTNENGFGGKGIYECYLVPFYEDPDGAMWYSPYVLHYYLSPTYSEDGTTLISNVMNFEALHQFDSAFNFTYTYQFDLVTYKYMDIRFSNWGKYCTFAAYDTYERYLSHNMYYWDNTAIFRQLDDLYAPDKLSTVSKNSSISTPFYTTDFDGDMGFICSSSLIEMNNHLPGMYPDKIDPNTTITMDGDNIYEYTIINESGDSTTINEYITNNYTIIVGGSGDGEGDTTINNWDISFGDFVLEIGTTIETSIKNSFNFLFVPDDDFMDDKMGQLKTNLEAKLPVIVDLPDIFSELFVEMDEDGNIIHSPLEDGTEGDPVISGDYDEDVYPKWELNVEFYGHKMCLTLLDFSIFKEVLPYVRLIIMAFVYVVYIRNFVNYLPSLIGNLISMGGNVSAIAEGANTDPYVKVNQYTGEVYSYRM